MAGDFLFTSESVTEGHPDKVADQISDAVLDGILTKDKMGRVACETFVTIGLVVVGGEITTTAYVDVNNLVRNVIKNIGYTDANYGFDYHTCSVLTSTCGVVAATLEFSAIEGTLEHQFATDVIDLRPTG